MPRATASAALSIVSDVAGGYSPSTPRCWHSRSLGRVTLLRHAGSAGRTRRHNPLGVMRNSSLLHGIIPMAQAAMACGDLIGAASVRMRPLPASCGAHQVAALAVRARVAIAQGTNPGQA